MAYKKKYKNKEEENEEWLRNIALLTGIKAHTPMTLEEIGAVLGCTRERVRQIEKRAVYKLKKALRERGITSYSDISADMFHTTNPFTED
jgi:DNA-directed RNA polymerase sigma subunit (sigma70/sigma32)